MLYRDGALLDAELYDLLYGPALLKNGRGRLERSRRWMSIGRLLCTLHWWRTAALRARSG